MNAANDHRRGTDHAACTADVSLWEDYDEAQRIARLRAAYRGVRQRVECRWELTRRSIDAERLWRVRDAITPAWATLVRAEEIADARSIFAHPGLPVALSRDMVRPVPHITYVGQHRPHQDDLLRRAYLDYVRRHDPRNGPMRA